MTYPPQQPQWAPPPPQPPKKNTGKIVGIGCASIVGLFVIVGVIGALASSGDKPATVTTSSPAAPASHATSAAPAQPAQTTKAPAGKPTDDVQLSECQADDTLHWPSAKVTITNHTAKSSNYLVQVEFLDASGTRVGQGLAATNNLAAGQSAVLKAQGAGEVTGQITCKVSDVTRYAAP